MREQLIFMVKKGQKNQFKTNQSQPTQPTDNNG